MVELLEIMLEDAKRNLMAGETEHLSRLQGEAQAFDRALRTLRRAPIMSENVEV